MNERTQPIVKGTDARGELVWGSEPMALWQCLMFPLRYFGDFSAFWQKRKKYVETGYDPDGMISASFSNTLPIEYGEKYANRRLRHQGD